MTRLARINLVAEEFRLTDVDEWSALIERHLQGGMALSDILVARQEVLSETCPHQDRCVVTHRAHPDHFEVQFHCPKCELTGVILVKRDSIKW